MNRTLKFAATTSLLVAGLALGGCTYDPAYYHRTGVVYSDGNAAVDRDDSYYYDSYYAPGYYSPAYYGPYWGPYYGGWGWPYVSLGFYGSWYSHHGYHGSYHPHSSGGRPAGGHSSPPSHHH